MSHTHSTNSLRLIILGALIIALFSLSPLITQAEGDVLAGIRARVAEAGSYSFVADIEQTMIPRPVPEMIGQTSQRVDLRAEGDVRLPDHVRLQITSEGNPSLPPMSIVQDGDQAFIQVGDERMEVDNPIGLAAPNGDFLSYLSGAENVMQSDAPPSTLYASRFTFDISGPRLARYIRDQMQAQMRANVELPPGVELAPSPILEAATGSGELWVGADGLPRRQILDLLMPGVAGSYDASVRISVDFSNFGTVNGNQGLGIRDQGSGISGQLSPAPSPPGSPAPQFPLILSPSAFILLITLLTFSAFVILSRRSPRQTYAAIVVVIIVSMVSTPLLQATQIVRFQERTAQARNQYSVDSDQYSVDGNQDYATRNLQSPIPNLQSPISNLSRSILDRGQSPTSDPQSTCGDGVPGEDTDLDGLDDTDEYCLGTDPFYGDSDRDMITDTLEIEGFEFGGRTWTSDPFKPDSNDDGLADIFEWPAPVGDAPNFDGVDDWDPDGDGIPNIWDADNDGDGVPDSLDLSPFFYTSYDDAFTLDSQGGNFAGTQYIEIQVQPQNQDHLRYSTTPLDWPYDTEGQIQDTADGDEDLRLIPMLQVHANQKPDTELARKYGLSAFENQDDGGYDLYAPLSPVGDGSQIVAFYAKVAYGPNELADIQWDNAQIVWMVQGPYANLIQTYTEDAFRVTGLQIIKSQDFQSAILGLPNAADSDQKLFNLLFGLSAAFLSNQSPDLPEIETRFSNPNTDIVETWGVPATDVVIDYAAYPHADAGLADISPRVKGFLDDNNYATDDTPSLVIAFQEESGIYSLSDQCKGASSCESSVTDAGFSVNLENLDLGTQRSLRQVSYEYEDDGWQDMYLQDILEMALERYDDLSGALADMHAQYPELTEDELESTILLFYTVWTLGQTRIVALNGQGIAPESRPDQDIYDQLALSTNTLPQYLVEAANLGQPGAGLRIGDDPSQLWQYHRDEDEASEFGIGGAVGDYYSWGKSLLPEGKAEYIANAAVRSFKTMLAVMTAVQCIQWATKGAYFGLTGWTKVSQSFGFASRMKFSIRVMGVIGLIFSLAVIWTQFGLTTDFDNPLARKQAIAYAVVATVFVILLFAISLNPIGAIFVMLLCLVDLIVYFATSGKVSIMGTAIKAVAEFFYDVNELTYLNDAEFTGMDSGLTDQEMGIIAGNRFWVSSDFEGQIKRTSDGDRGDLDDSYVYGKFNAWSSDAAAVNKNSSSCSGDGSGVSGKTLTCYNEAKVEYEFTGPVVNAQLSLKAYIRAKVYYEECSIAGLFCSRDRSYIDLPEDLDKKDRWDSMSIYLDVLPDNLEGLWTWDALTNPDRDGDGILNSQETSTDPDLWDTDGDGLSDKYEFDAQETLGTDPLNSDTDGDGLDDGFEHRLHTRIDEADTDGDGLTDAEEVYHQTSSGDWGGGWAVNLPGPAAAAWVFSDPLSTDADNDGLDDFSERANGTSPYAYNDAPRLIIAAAPLAASPGGAIGAYLEPGDSLAITLTLDSVGPRPITQTLSLCLPDFLIDIQGGDLTGDRTPPTQPAPDCNGFQWSFAGGHTLQIWETVSITLTAVIDPGQGSAFAEVLAALPYQVSDTLEEITARVALVVDDDLPAVTLTAPADGYLIGGGVDYYVAGGAADDPTTWITRVDIDLPAGAGTATAEGVSPWAYTWELPADGVYDLTATAYDYLGHASPPDSVQVTVDNTPPTTTLDLNEGDFVTGQVGRAGLITVTLTGTASDNLSGLTRVQISTDDKPWREVPLTPTLSQGERKSDSPLPLGEGLGVRVNAATWSTHWLLPDEASAQGEHTVALRAFGMVHFQVKSSLQIE